MNALEIAVLIIAAPFLLAIGTVVSAAAVWLLCIVTTYTVEFVCAFVVAFIDFYRWLFTGRE